MDRKTGWRTKMKIRWAALFLSASFLFVQSGCYITELNEKSLVSMIGIDRNKEGKLKVTVGLISPRKMESNAEKAVLIYSTEGKTIFDAIRNLVMEIGNQPLWPYVKIVVIGPSVAQKDVTPILDFFNRNNEVQPNPYVVMSKEPAEEILNLKTDMSNLPALVVEKQIENQSLLGYAPQVTFYQFNEMMYSQEKVGYTTLIQRERKKTGYIPKVQGMAVLKKGAWIGDLNEKETRGVLWVRHEVQGGILVPDFGDSEPGGDIKIALEIIQQNMSDIQPKLTNGQLSVTIHIRSALSIGEVLGSMPLNRERTDQIVKLAEALIREEVKASLEKTQKQWKTDIYGIHDVVHRKYPDYWRSHKDNWDQIFSTLPIEVHVTADIKKLGLFK